MIEFIYLEVKISIIIILMIFMNIDWVSIDINRLSKWKIINLNIFRCGSKSKS